MAAPVIQPSFAAGEVSPALYGRVDLAKYRTGLARCRNFIVDYRGGTSNRTGTQLIGRCLQSTTDVVLRPFNFNAEQNYVLEFSHLRMRVIRLGGYVLEDARVITAVTQGSQGRVTTSVNHGYTDGDWVYFDGVVGMTELNGRTFIVDVFDANEFDLLDLNGVPVATTDYGAYVSGGTSSRVYTLVTPWSADHVRYLGMAQSNDTMTITHPLYPVYTLTRTDHDAWVVALEDFGVPAIEPPDGVVADPTAPGGGINYAYVITAVAETGEESLPSDRAIADSVNISTTAGAIEVTWEAVEGAKYYNVYKGQVGLGTDVPIGSAYGYVGTAYGLSYVDSNIIADFARTPPIHYNPFAPSPVDEIDISAPGSGYDETTTISIVDTDPDPGSGAVAVPVIIGGEVAGIIISNRGEGYHQATTTATVVGGGGVGATLTITIGAASGNFPGEVVYFQQRKIYAATINQPSTLFGTRPGSEKNMDYSNPTNDGDSIELPLYSLQANAIKSMIPMPGGLVVFTGSGAWQLSGGQPNQAMTATTAIAVPQAYHGASDLPPLAVGSEILYVQNKGNVVRNLSYNFFSNIYTGADMSVLSAHLLEGRTIVDWAYAEEPFKIATAVLSDGQMLFFTFLKEQEVYAWSRHDTRGLFGSVAVIEEGSIDAVYVTCRRLIGSSWVRFTERFAARDTLNGAEAGWFLDCALATPLPEPAADLTYDALSGEVTFTADAAVFSADDVGKVLRTSRGKAIITEFTSTTVLVGETITDFWSPIEGQPVPSAEGTWTLTEPFSRVTGLEHLIGETVDVLADGGVYKNLVVDADGGVDLDAPASRVLVGLAIRGQFQTLDLEVGEPTVQGRRKKITAVTVRMEASRGFKIGPDFDHLEEARGWPTAQDLGTDPDLLTGDLRVNIPPSWNAAGRVCIQQDYPLAMKILAIVPEITVGDS